MITWLIYATSLLQLLLSVRRAGSGRELELVFYRMRQDEVRIQAYIVYCFDLCSLDLRLKALRCTLILKIDYVI